MVVLCQNPQKHYNWVFLWNILTVRDLVVVIVFYIQSYRKKLEKVNFNLFSQVYCKGAHSLVAEHVQWIVKRKQASSEIDLCQLMSRMYAKLFTIHFESAFILCIGVHGFCKFLSKKVVSNFTIFDSSLYKFNEALSKTKNENIAGRGGWEREGEN